MTIKNYFYRFAGLMILLLAGIFFAQKPLSAQIFNIFPTNTPMPIAAPSAAVSVVPTGATVLIPEEVTTNTSALVNTDTIVVKDAQTMYLGGSFSEVRFAENEPVQRLRLAAVDLQLQQVTEWNPRPNDSVYALYVDETTLWAGGRFTAVADENRLFIASFSKPNLVLNQTAIDANNDVFAIAGNDTTVYVGGTFTEIGGQQRTYIAAIDKATGTVTGWNPTLSHQVHNIVIQDNTIIASGPYPLEDSSETLNYIATIDPATAQVSNLQAVNAQGTPVPVAGNATLTQSILLDQDALGFQIPNLAQVLTFAIRMFFTIAGLMALFYLLIGAMEWITSGGDEDKVTASRKKIIAAIVGLILIVVVLAVVVTLEQIVFQGRVCVGISCAATIPSLIKAL